MKTVKKTLPKDIQKVAKRAVLKRAIPFTAVEILVISYIHLYGETSFKMVEGFVKPLIYAALVVLPFFIFGMQKLIDHSWRGEIIKINVHAGYDSSNRHLFEARYLILTIKREDGKIIDHTVNAFAGRHTLLTTYVKSNLSSGKSEYAEDDYKVGDRVYHYYGLPKLLIVHSNKSSDCVICGANNPEANDRCFFCGHSIIKKTF